MVLMLVFIAPLDTRANRNTHKCETGRNIGAKWICIRILHAHKFLVRKGLVFILWIWIDLLVLCHGKKVYWFPLNKVGFTISYWIPTSTPGERFSFASPQGKFSGFSLFFFFLVFKFSLYFLPLFISPAMILVLLNSISNKFEKC